VASPFLTVLSSRPAIAEALSRVGWLQTPEQRKPPPVLDLARERREAPWSPPPSDSLAALIEDPTLNALHIAIIDGHAGAQDDPRHCELVASARRKLCAGARHAITSEEEHHLVLDGVALTELYLEHWRRTGGEPRRRDVSGARRAAPHPSRAP
jgi:membrane glycosyltransferase